MCCYYNIINLVTSQERPGLDQFDSNNYSEASADYPWPYT